jgi:hypothetical protein
VPPSQGRTGLSRLRRFKLYNERIFGSRLPADMEVSRFGRARAAAPLPRRGSV